MSNEVTKGKLFLQEVLNRLTGDNDAAKAAQITRKSLSAFEGQIAALNAQLVDDENTLEDAKTALNNAIYPINLFKDNRNYCALIVDAQEAIDEAQETVDNTTNSIKYFQDLLAKVTSTDNVA